MKAAPVIIEHNLEERQEIIQDVVDRLLSNPEYKAALLALNQQYPSKNYNRRLESYQPKKN
ncbi:MAG: hypothetical protein V4547_18150 [Bacteroidota bacterium]